MAERAAGEDLRQCLSAERPGERAGGGDRGAGRQQQLGRPGAGRARRTGSLRGCTRSARVSTTRSCPGDNSTYIGGPGAILDGQGKNRYAFTQHARNVTIKYLTIRNFVAPMNEGTVNHDSGENWTMQYNTVINNGGAGIFVGAGNVASYNCLKDNSQYGFQAYGREGGESNIVLDHNEIVGNNTGDWETKIEGCGCTGGGKFWDVRNVKVTNNYVHDNKSVGLWADTNDNNFLFEGNWIENNDGQAIFWEISYNAAIRNNVIRHNLIEIGPRPHPVRRQLPGRGDLHLRVRWRRPGAVRPGGQPDHRHLEQPDRGQLQRGDAVGERRPVLRLAGQHLDRLLHAGEPVGGQAVDLQRRRTSPRRRTTPTAGGRPRTSRCTTTPSR